MAVRSRRDRDRELQRAGAVRLVFPLLPGATSPPGPPPLAAGLGAAVPRGRRAERAKQTDQRAIGACGALVIKLTGDRSVVGNISVAGRGAAGTSNPPSYSPPSPPDAAPSPATYAARTFGELSICFSAATGNIVTSAQESSLFSEGCCF